MVYEKQYSRSFSSENLNLFDWKDDADILFV